MDIITIIFIALGLAMDAFAVSIASAVTIKREKIRKAILFGLMFGGFQMLMPIIGWSAGYTFRSFVSGIDHWIAFGLLVFIGFKMIYEAMNIEKLESAGSEITAIVLLGLSIATSIDALAVGISFTFLEISIFLPVVMIGIITFFMSFAGVLLGSKYGGFFEKKIEVLGGIILIIIGIKILVSHLA